MLINSFNTLPKNYKFNLNVSSSISSNELNQLIDYNTTILNNCNNINRINRININDNGDRNGLFNLIKNEGIQNISLNEENSSTISNNNHFFELKFQSNKFNNLNIDDLVFQFQFKKDLNKNQTLNKLNKFRLYTSLEKVLYNIITNTLFMFDEEMDNVNENENEIQNHQHQNYNLKSLELLFSKLSKDSTIKRISFIDINGLVNSSLSGINKSDIYNGFKNILSSEYTTNLKSFSFKSSSNQLDISLLDGLSLNKTVTDLHINDNNFIQIINHSLINNKTIRNLFINHNNIENDNINNIIDGLKLISKQNQIELYSISFDIKTNDNNFNSLIQFIQSQQFENIKEINIINNFNPYLFNNIKSYQLLLNNTILNVSYKY